MAVHGEVYLIISLRFNFPRNFVPFIFSQILSQALRKYSVNFKSDPLVHSDAYFYHGKIVSGQGHVRFYIETYF